MRSAILLVVAGCTYTPTTLDTSVSCERGYQDNDGDGTCTIGCLAIAWDVLEPESGGCLDCDDSSGRATCVCADGPATGPLWACPCDVTDCGDHGTCQMVGGEWGECVCDDGYQDNNHDTVCAPACDLVGCGDRCDDATGEATCCIVIVDPATGNAAHGGTSWSDAIADLQQGIDVAAEQTVAGGGPCQVWMSNGTGDALVINDTIRMAEDVAVFGGVPPGAVSLYDRGDPWLARTSIYTTGGASPAFEAASRAHLEGFAFHLVNASDDGAALVASGVRDLTLRHLDFIGNSTVATGGAFVLDASHDVWLEDCYFEANTATLGGALASYDSDAVVAGGAFVANQALGTMGLGGAIYAVDSSLQFYGTTFVYNLARRQGGAIFMQGSGQDQLRLDNAILTENDAWDGADTLGGAVATSGVAVTIDRTTFTSNTASRGGALSNKDGAAEVSNSLLAANGANGNSPPGAAAIEVSGNSARTNLINTTVVGNTVAQGAALHANGGEVTLINSVVAVDAVPAIDNVGTVTARYSIVPETPCADALGCFLQAGVHEGAPRFRTARASGTIVSAAVNDALSSVLDVGGDMGWPENLWSGRFLRTADGWIYFIYGNTASHLWILGDLESPGQAFTILDYQLSGASAGIDAADGNSAPESDKHWHLRVDAPDIDNTGIGDPPFVDIGCFETGPD